MRRVGLLHVFLVSSLCYVFYLGKMHYLMYDCLLLIEHCCDAGMPWSWLSEPPSKQRPVAIQESVSRQHRPEVAGPVVVDGWVSTETHPF